MKKLSILFLSIFSLIMVACGEDEAELMFSVETISDRNNVKIEYYSPDPCCISKMYHILTNRLSSELTLKCTNADNITISSIPDTDNNSDITYTSTTGHWTATIISSNTIRFTFDEINDYSVDEIYSFHDILAISAKTKKGMLSTSIQIARLPHSSNPL